MPELNRFVRAIGFGLSAAIDMAFAAENFPKWREAVKRRRSEFAWRRKTLSMPMN
ncbi:hypothetical protein LPB260_14775 [Pseudomonas sp. LPB0260]|uniref:hypothetical protein n=1 Tax=Pseudomonas sp. LPB0260 TaxID=2614442 RepID=UPI0015C1E280|nr:hypothetical protein [Pseudomonas sp. LPB0260]QLC74832.1 hypothetical protein LPB260_14775 [Pseudomonas sp. LPB0260]